MGLKNLIGQRFGYLIVLSRAPDHITSSGQKKTAWLCRCDCGTECIKVGAELTRKKNAVISCGCAALELRKNNNFSTKEPNEYFIDVNNIVHIKLTKNKEALVDKDDLEKVLKYRWFARFTKTDVVYATAHCKRTKGEHIQMHQLIMGLKNIDHINGNGLDNRKENLRHYNNQGQNKVNSPKYNYKRNPTSKYKGVYWSKKDNKFRASCGGFYLGLFNTEKEAAIAYNNKASELYGEFAKLNVIAGTEEVEL